MSRFQGMSDYTHGTEERLGILLTNLGTPEVPTTASLRRYLAEFLWDPRVVEVPRPIWWLVLNGIILRTRPRRSAQAYESVWTEQGSPLMVISRQQQTALQQRLESALPGPVTVALAMRYGKPAFRESLEQLRDAGARRILVLPLYPQYSSATTASTFDMVTQVLRKWRWVPEMRFVMHYHDDPYYIEALANSVRENWDIRGKRPDKLLFSFHGIPRKAQLDGDPYLCECHKTGRLVAEKLGLEEGSWQVTFQSRFGPAEWIKPYTDKTLQAWGREGVKSVDVICPGFSADCLETLEEIAEENQERFLAAGGEEFHYIPALNARDDHMDALQKIILQHIQGWPETSPQWNVQQQKAAAEIAVERARAMGAER